MLVAAPLPPADILLRARGLAGLTLGELADRLSLPLPAAPARAKGFVGRLVERALGVDAEFRGPTDFPDCELKTLPVDALGRPRESTFVCHVQVSQLAEVAWEASRVRAKLARVLFVPVESGEGLVHCERRIGCAFLWQMSPTEEAVLREDYCVHAEHVARGQLEALDARYGTALQIRPKAANSQVRVRAHDADGVPLRVLPRAFYLRAAFTQALVRGALGQPA